MPEPRVRCGNDPRARLDPEARTEVDKVAADLEETQAVQPTVVCICGSMRFRQEMAEAAAAESLAGRIVVMPHVSTKLWGDTEPDARQKADLGLLHRAKIRLAQEILVVGDYVGDSTRAEIEYACHLGRPVRFTHPEADPEGGAAGLPGKRT